MPLKARLIDLMQREIQEEEAFIASLTASALAEQGTLDRWSARDILAHIAAWKENMVNGLQETARGGATAWDEDEDAANARIYELHRHDTPEQVIAVLRQANLRLLGAVQALTEEELMDVSRNPWRSQRPAWTSIAGNSITHPLSHLAQYTLARGDLERGTYLFETAGDLLLELDDSPNSRATALYNMACAYAMAGLPEKALANLEEALKLNPDLIDWSQQDPDLVPLHGLPAYQALYAN